MHLRPMQLADVPDVADLSAQGHLDDEVTAFIAPDRHRYYASYRNGFVRRIHARRLRPGWFYWVAETDPGDEATAGQKERCEEEQGGKVIGYAAWLRAGNDPVARKWQNMNESWSTKIQSYLAEVKNQYWTLFKLDWSEKTCNRATLSRCFEETFDRSIFPEAWHLENAVVHRDYQRRGVGAYLVQWGLDQASAERVPCGVESTSAGLRLYEKMGFRKFDDMRFGDEEAETLTVMVWEPPGMKDQWFIPAKNALDVERNRKSHLS